MNANFKCINNQVRRWVELEFEESFLKITTYFKYFRQKVLMIILYFLVLGTNVAIKVSMSFF